MQNRAHGTDSAYKHSEQALGYYMEDARFMTIVLNKLQRLHQGGVAKVHRAMLDLHTTRYMCGNCETRVKSLVNPEGHFVRHLSAAARKKFGAWTVPFGGVKLVARVSATYPFAREQVTATQHSDGVIDEEMMQAHRVFVRDASSAPLPSLSAQPTTMERLSQLLTWYSVAISGGASANKAQYRDAFNDLVQPLMTMAQTRIARCWRRFVFLRLLSAVAYQNRVTPEEFFKGSQAGSSHPVAEQLTRFGHRRSPPPATQVVDDLAEQLDQAARIGPQSPTSSSG